MRRSTIVVIMMMLDVGVVYANTTNELDIAEKARTGSFVYKCERILNVEAPWSVTSTNTLQDNKRFISAWISEDINGTGSSELGKMQKREMEGFLSGLMQWIGEPGFSVISCTPEQYAKMLTAHLRGIANRAGCQLKCDTKVVPNQEPKATGEPAP